MARPKLTHCKRGHEIAIVGRTTSNTCCECARARQRVENMTLARVEHERARNRNRRKNLTPEQLERRRAADRVYAARRRAQIDADPVRRIQRLNQLAQYWRRRHLAALEQQLQEM